LDQINPHSEIWPRAGNRNNTALITAAVIAFLVVVGLFIWAASSGQQTADNPAAQTTTGQGGHPPIQAPRNKPQGLKR
jgi:hypothetical protein